MISATLRPLDCMSLEGSIISKKLSSQRVFLSLFQMPLCLCSGCPTVLVPSANWSLNLWVSPDGIHLTAESTLYIHVVL